MASGPLTDIKDSTKSTWKPTTLKDEYIYDLMASQNSFTIVTSADGKIMFVSPTCEMFLGHSYHDMIGFDLHCFVHPSDICTVNGYLQEAKRHMISKGVLLSQRITFRCRMKEKCQPRTEVFAYQYVNITGFMKMFPEVSKNVKEVCLKRYGASRRKLSTLSTLRTMFFAVVQIVKLNPRDLFLSEANDDEYRTRLTLDGRLVDADHRISLITGHFPDEVRGNSAYDYIHEDDLPISLFAHKLMLSNSNGTGVIVHRLRTCSNSYVFVQSAGYLDYDKDTGSVSHFVCVSKLLIDHEGMEERNKFVNKFTPHISNSSAKALYESLKVVVGPRSSQLTYEQSTGCLTEAGSHSKTQVNTTVPLANPHNPAEAMEVIDRIAQRYGVFNPPVVVSSTTNEDEEESQFAAQNEANQVCHPIPYYGTLPLLRQLNNSYGGDILANPMSHFQSTMSHPGYSINSMTQFNGVNQPMTGAIVFNFGERNNVPQFSNNMHFNPFARENMYTPFNHNSNVHSFDSTLNQDSDSSQSVTSPSESNADCGSYDDNGIYDITAEEETDFKPVFNVQTNEQQHVCPDEENEFNFLEPIPSMFSDKEEFSPILLTDHNTANELLATDHWSETLENDLISAKKA
ncbi:aryl hydrocarbon receptor nuclear translocator-like protein [Leptotrombidium deliense]|uniref:Aryl hydrocarbon receptor nuclear translocator-like protein n=1 Tax=Leptotrombidium deliense TaxID=299467 RepID=A0A443SJ93_9ACAR|nr:aryl hydrocarbon receptor nuclear translocator-like protein [Leptotrombidium deliense]